MTKKYLNIGNEQPKVESLIANLCDYDDGYICDVITEIADNNTSIYYNDIFNFMRENPEAVDDAINEFGWEGCGGTLERAAQMGEFITLEREMYAELDEGIYNYALNFILHDLGIWHLPGDVFDEVGDICDNYDNNDRLDALRDELTELLIVRNIIDEDGEITDEYDAELDRADEAGELN